MRRKLVIAILVVVVLAVVAAEFGLFDSNHNGSYRQPSQHLKRDSSDPAQLLPGASPDDTKRLAPCYNCVNGITPYSPPIEALNASGQQQIVNPVVGMKVCVYVNGAEQSVNPWQPLVITVVYQRGDQRFVTLRVDTRNGGDFGSKSDVSWGFVPDNQGRWQGAVIMPPCPTDSGSTSWSPLVASGEGHFGPSLPTLSNVNLIWWVQKDET